jgi:hypothetical protein
MQMDRDQAANLRPSLLIASQLIPIRVFSRKKEDPNDA